ncbi:unnamed protein product [Choristocarpus tenellus]
MDCPLANFSHSEQVCVQEIILIVGGYVCRIFRGELPAGANSAKTCIVPPHPREGLAEHEHMVPPPCGRRKERKALGGKSMASKNDGALSQDALGAPLFWVIQTGVVLYVARELGWW